MKNEETPFGAPPNTIDKAVSPYKFVVPPQFQDLHFRFLKVRSHAKEAVEPGWQKVKNYSWSHPEIAQWIRAGGNYGVTCPSGFCAFVDADYLEIQNALEKTLPLTFRWSTGKPGHYQYAYFIENGPLGCVPLMDGAYIKGKGGYVIGPGSVHPSGVVYGSREIRDAPIAVVKKEDLMRAVSPFLEKETSTANSNETVYERASSVTGEMIEKVALDLLPEWTNADHKRHVMTLAIIGTWERLGWSMSEVQALIDTLIRESGKGQEHSAQVRYAYGRGDRKYGIPTLKQISEDLK
jgi:hypothetical protein